MPAVKALTYQEFLERLSRQPLPRLRTPAEEVIRHFRPEGQPYAGFTPVTYLLDYAERSYVHVEANCQQVYGYTADTFLEWGLDGYLAQWHPADFEVINRKVFPEIHAFLKTLKKEAFADYIFSYNYRFRNARGHYITILQRFSYLGSDVDGLPGGVVGITLDITHFKTNDSVVYTIERVADTPAGKTLDLLVKKSYPVFDAAGCPFTRTETEVLRRIAEGKSSKQIAAELYVSVNTVNIHRKNMLAKTGCTSSSALISLAAQSGLL